MKTLRQICAATTLALVLAVHALAGQIHSTGVVAPPPPPPSETATQGSMTTTLILTIISLIPIP